MQSRARNSNSVRQPKPHRGEVKARRSRRAVTVACWPSSGSDHPEGCRPIVESAGGRAAQARGIARRSVERQPGTARWGPACSTRSSTVGQRSRAAGLPKKEPRSRTSRGTYRRLRLVFGAFPIPSFRITSSSGIVFTSPASIAAIRLSAIRISSNSPGSLPSSAQSTVNLFDGSSSKPKVAGR